MKKAMFQLFLGVVVLAAFSVCAQDAGSAKADLQAGVQNPDVQKEFDEPDGCAILNKPDGSFCIFARGTGTYDFDDVDDIADARKEGTLKAKAVLAKFMKEKLSTEEGFSEASKKVKTASSDGQTENVSVSKETVKVNTQEIKNSAEALLKGVITLKEQKIPRKGNSGEIQITVGVSSKTLLAAGKLVQAIDATPEQGQGGQVGTGSSGVSVPVDGRNNRPEVRRANTDF